MYIIVRRYNQSNDFERCATIILRQVDYKEFIEFHCFSN